MCAKKYQGLQPMTRVESFAMEFKGILATPPQSYPPQEIAGLIFRAY